MRKLRTYRTTLLSMIMASVMLLGLAAPACGAPLDLTVTTGAGSGAGSLADAVAQANAHPGVDTITIASGITVNLDDTIFIEGSLILNGVSDGTPIIQPSSSFNNINQVLLMVVNGVGDPGDLTMSNIVVDGRSDLAMSCLYHENNSNINIDGVTIRNCLNGGWTSKSAQGKIVVRNSTFTNNGKLDEDSGAIHFTNRVTAHEITIIDSYFSENYSNSGGAIVGDTLEDIPVTISGSVFENNSSDQYGGAVWFRYILQSMNVMHIKDSSFSGNTARWRSGGALSFLGTELNVPTGVEGPRLLIERSSFFENSAPTGTSINFGNLYQFQSSKEVASSVRISNSTFDEIEVFSGSSPKEGTGAIIFSENHSAVFEVQHSTIVGGGIYVAFNGGLFMSKFDSENGAIYVSNSIIDSGQNVAFIVENQESIDDELITSFNALTRPSLVPINSNLLVSREQLALEPLADNGGKTRTRQPGSGSVVIDAGDPGFAGAPELDQRGHDRKSGLAVDVGAVEVNPGSVRLVSDVTVERGNTAVFQVERFGGSDGIASVTVTTVDGTAHAGDDFEPVSHVITWAAGESGPKTVSVPTVQVGPSAEALSFTLTISDLTHGVLFADPTVVIGHILPVEPPITPPTPTPTTEPTPPAVPSLAAPVPAASTPPSRATIALTGSPLALWALAAAVLVLVGTAFFIPCIARTRRARRENAERA